MKQRLVTASVDHYCASGDCAKKKILAGTAHVWYRAQGLRYHKECDPEVVLDPTQAPANWNMKRERR